MASVNLSPELKYWLFNMLCILYVLQVMVPLGFCELVPAMFDPVTKQVYYNPQAQSQVSGAGTNQGLVMTVAQDVKVEATSRESKSENFGVNLGLGDAPLIGLNYQKAKIRETRQESHHQVNIAIKIPGECSEGCREQANKAFDIANNALYGGSKQKQVNLPQPEARNQDPGTMFNNKEKKERREEKKREEEKREEKKAGKESSS